MPVDSCNPDDEDENGCYDGDERFIEAELVEKPVKDTSEDARSGVDLLLENERYLVGQDVPDDSSGCRGHDSHHHGHQEACFVLERFASTDDQERCQAQGVEVEEGSVQEIEAVVKIEDKKAYHDGQVEVVLVCETEGRDGAEKDIPDRSATDCGDETQDDYAQQVHLSLDTGEGA